MAIDSEEKPWPIAVTAYNLHQAPLKPLVAYGSRGFSYLGQSCLRSGHQRNTDILPLPDDRVTILFVQRLYKT